MSDSAWVSSIRHERPTHIRHFAQHLPEAFALLRSASRKIRHELDLTQQDFAALLGVSLATVRKWERGNGEPSGAAKTLLAVVRTHPDIVRKAALAVV